MVEASDPNANYYQREDEPDMSDPGTALDMYESQKASLPTLGQILETVQQMETQLGDIYNYARANNLSELAQTAKKVWKRTQHLHQHIQRQDAVQRGADAVIEAVSEQRDELLNEMRELTEAINMGSESHPLLSDWAEEIRNDAAEKQSELDADMADESAYDDAVGNVTEDISIALTNIGISTARAEFYASELMTIFTSPHVDFDENQAAIMRQLCETFPLPDEVFQQEEFDAAVDGRTIELQREQQRVVFDEAEFYTDDDAEEFDVDD